MIDNVMPKIVEYSYSIQTKKCNTKEPLWTCDERKVASSIVSFNVENDEKLPYPDMKIINVDGFYLINGTRNQLTLF